jgi:hypothetical protein
MNNILESIMAMHVSLVMTTKMLEEKHAGIAVNVILQDKIVRISVTKIVTTGVL